MVKVVVPQAAAPELGNVHLGILIRISSFATSPALLVKVKVTLPGGAPDTPLAYCRDIADRPALGTAGLVGIAATSTALMPVPVVAAAVYWL